MRRPILSDYMIIAEYPIRWNRATSSGGCAKQKAVTLVVFSIYSTVMLYVVGFGYN